MTFMRRVMGGDLRGANYTLTEKGKMQSEEYTGDALSRILSAIDEQGGDADINDIAAASGLPKALVEVKLKIAVRKHLVVAAKQQREEFNA